MEPINASNAAADSHYLNGPSPGLRQASSTASSSIVAEIIDTVDLSPEGKAALKSGIPPMPASAERPAANDTMGDTKQDTDLLAEATLIEGLLDDDEEEDELLLR